MKQLLSLALLFISYFENLHAQKPASSLQLFTADNPYFQYTGRIDFSSPTMPCYWQPGVYVKAKFNGSHCIVLINDEMLSAETHNYIEIVIDHQKPERLQLKEKQNEIDAGKNLAEGDHTILICKDTEANIGYIEFVGLKCHSLKKLPAKPVRKIECIGNSITCGTGSDQSEIPCGKGVWQDQHNAYMSYGAVTARNLNALYHLSAVSGIGLMHSCCKLEIVMPQVFDKINMREDNIAWNFQNYIPAVVTICLGQNDGIQDSVTFCNKYLSFIKQVRTQYDKANIVCLTSPMADERLVVVMKKYLTSIVDAANKAGDKKVSSYFFSKRYHNGCDTHPDLAEHQEIAAELTDYLKRLMRW
jgi:hypothetical protein